MTARKRKILIVDDDPAMLASFDIVLQSWGFEVFQAPDARKAKEVTARKSPDIVITDVVMPGMSGMELLRDLKAGDPERPVFLVTAQGSIDMAVEAIKLGAQDFITKPITDFQKLKTLLDDAERGIQQRIKTKRLSSRLEADGGFGEFVGTSKPMKEVFALIERVADREVPVIITGESGTGKELVARAIHRLSARSNKPFVAVNAAAIPESLMESEVFGHERGAFTGAAGTRPGCFEQAHGGTLFLDEIAEMPVALQPKLLRVLADGRVRRLGGSNEFAFDVRVVVATNRDPLKAIEEGRLREDLYYRLNVFSVMLPPLRERHEDIALLAQRFVEDFNRKHQTEVKGVSEEATKILTAYSWPGNVRELRNVMERAVVLTKSNWITEDALPASIRSGHSADQKLVLDVGNTTVAEAEKELLIRTLKLAGNNKAEAARLLGLDVKTIYNKLKTYNIEP
jgi:DNA-binding NtrC family response regulator